MLEENVKKSTNSKIELDEINSIDYSYNAEKIAKPNLTKMVDESENRNNILDINDNIIENSNILIFDTNEATDMINMTDSKHLNNHIENQKKSKNYITNMVETIPISGMFLLINLSYLTFKFIIKCY